MLGNRHTRNSCPFPKKWLKRSSSKVWDETLYNNRFTILAVDDDNDDNDEDETITKRINIALPVLDQATGKTLEHGQLHQHPKYKDVWDRSTLTD